MPETYKGFVMKKILCLSFILTIIFLDVFAQKDIITIDNVKYKLNQTTQTAKVIYAKNQKVITIPNSISNKKVTYTVNSIAESAFSDVEIVKKVYSSLDAEAVRLIKNMSKKWKPGMRNGIFVRCKYTLPISFRF